MCGRYVLYDEREIYEIRQILEDIAKTFGKETTDSIKKGEISPTDIAPIVCQNKQTPLPKALKWGYVIQGSKSTIINARCESIFEKPFFSQSIINKKCLIPANAFYEWETQGKLKVKHTISLSNESFFYMCGLYAPFFIDGNKTERFVIITQNANEQMSKIHNRMPLIVPKELKDDWLKETQNIKNLVDAIINFKLKFEIA